MYYNQAMPHFPPTPVPMFNNVLKVTGEGRISVAPDRAIVILGAITEHTNLQVAQTENANTVSRIIDSLVNLGIPQEKIKTTQYRIDIQYDYQNGQQIFRGYKVTHLLQVTVDQIELTGRVVDTAVNQGANHVSSIQFSVANPEAYYNQALSLAIQDSHRKALTMAGTLGVTLNRIPHQVQEVSQIAEPVPLETTMFAARAETPIQPGELQISAAVRAEYYYFLA